LYLLSIVKLVLQFFVILVIGFAKIIQFGLCC